MIFFDIILHFGNEAVRSGRVARLLCLPDVDTGQTPRCPGSSPGTDPWRSRFHIFHELSPHGVYLHECLRRTSHDDHFLGFFHTSPLSIRIRIIIRIYFSIHQDHHPKIPQIHCVQRASWKPWRSPGGARDPLPRSLFGQKLAHRQVPGPSVGTEPQLNMTITTIKIHYLNCLNRG